MPVEPRSIGVAADCSVLVPVLNEERYIEQTLQTMRAQRFPGRLEFIFADGGSSDRTVQILRDHAERDPRIRVYANPRRAVASGLNVALSHSSGRWIARMDAHTEYRDDYLAVGVERLQQGGTSWVSGPPIPVGHGPVSRAVALALASAVGQGGSRKWRRAGDDAPHEFGSTPACSRGCGSAAPCSPLAAGMRAGSSMRTQRWPAGSWLAASG